MADKYILVGLTEKRFAIAKRQLNGWWRVVATGTERDMKDLLDERKSSAPVDAAPAADRGPGYGASGYLWGREGTRPCYRPLGELDWRYWPLGDPVPAGKTINLDIGPPR